MRAFALSAVAALLFPMACVDGSQYHARETNAGQITGQLNGLSVDGNRIVNGAGRPLRLLGFNHSGSEYACIEGWGMFDEPDPGRPPTPAFVRAMANWRGSNVVRVPLNEQCWLGIGVPPAFGGKRYQNAIREYVDTLNANGLVAVLDLHRSAPGAARSLNQEAMPDRDHSIEFWHQVAAAYKNNASVVFDLFNEPHPFDETNTVRAWRCWRDGGCTLRSSNGGGNYVAAGMNELVRAVRGAGARNVLLAGGIYWAESLTQWLEYRPTDPLGNIAASFHAYALNEYCASLRCYNTDLARVAAAVPLFAGEVGPDQVDQSCALSSVRDTGWSKTIFDWLDRHDSNYTAWTWNDWHDCWSLITAPSGTPTPVWGRQVRDRLASHA
jgi:endoglucanase